MTFCQRIKKKENLAETDASCFAVDENAIKTTQNTEKNYQAPFSTTSERKERTGRRHRHARADFPQSSGKTRSTLKNPPLKRISDNTINCTYIVYYV